MTEIEKYESVREYGEKHEISVNSVLKKIGVSSSGYYSWKVRGISKRERKKTEIKEQIKEIHKKSKEIYGAPKIREELKKSGYEVSQKTVSKYMREEGIRAVWIKKYRATVKKKDVEDELRNVLNREFKPERMDKVWVTDITYIWTSKGFVYLTSVMDLYSRKIISWDVSESLGVETVIKAIREAKRGRNLDKTLIIHSDRGSQYTSREYRKETEHRKIVRSYSRKGVPWDNAVIESFHSIIKRECLNRYKLGDKDDVRRIVFEYIETFYNRKRLHSHCGMLSPEEYEKEENKKISV